MNVHVIQYNSGFPGQVAPDIDIIIDESEALEQFGEPDSKVANEWLYF